MKKVTYCPYCDKYAEPSLHFCPFCSSQAIFWPSWEKKSEEEREEWMLKWPKNSNPKPLFSGEVRMRNAERFDKETKAAIKEEQARKQYIPKCPTCGSPNLSKIGAGSKLLDVAFWGFASGKVRKTFHCDDCGYEW